MKKTKISDKIVFEKEIKMSGVVRRAVFNNKAFGYAEAFAEQEGREKSAQEILERAASLRVFDVTVLLFGALKAGNEKYTAERFKKEFTINDFAEYLDIVKSGIEKFLPENESDAEKNA